jgi:ATP-binding cassette subfamily B protein
MSHDHGFEEESLGKAYDGRLMARLIRYLRPSRLLVATATVLLILFSISQLAGPILTKRAIDDHILANDLDGLFAVCAMWLGLIVFGAILQYAQIVIMNLIGQRAMLTMRDELYAHLQRLPLSFYDRNPVGRLMTRLTNDVEVLNQMFTQGVVALFGDLFTLIGILIVLFIMDWQLALVTLASLPLLIVVTLQFRKRLRGAYRDVRIALAKINSYLQESLSGIAIIKALQREKKNEEEFEELAANHRDAFLRSVKAFSTYYPLVEIIEALSIALILWYGGGRVVQEALTLGSLVAFIQYAGRFFRPIRDLSEKYNILQDAMSSSERIFELLDTEPEIEVDDCDAVTNVIYDTGDVVFEDVHFSYDGKTPVLRGLDLVMPAGKTTAIVGSTGAGKTTIISLLSRFYGPDEGRITVGGVDLQSIPRPALRSRMAVVAQDVFLFSGTVEQNIRLGRPDISDSDLSEALRRSRAEHLVSRLPDGIQSEVTERGGSFSAGERQLLAFARALAFDPAILVLDEATASIDSETEALIQEALHSLLRDRTAIVIAHRLSTIRDADQIVVLHRGRVAEKGTHDELMGTKGVYEKLYRMQFEGRAEVAG